MQFSRPLQDIDDFLPLFWSSRLRVDVLINGRKDERHERELVVARQGHPFINREELTDTAFIGKLYLPVLLLPR